MGERQRQRILLVGGGLANTLLAFRLKITRPDVDWILFEKTSRLGGEHTWSFHESDLSPLQNRWLAPFVSHRWPAYVVKFPTYDRVLTSSYQTLRCGPGVPPSQDFHLKMMPHLGANCRFGLPIREIGPQHLTTDDGVTHEGALVVDGRGLDSLGADQRSLEGQKTCGYQKFTGLTLETPRPHGITYPIVMDARVDQAEGFRFVYVLPWSPYQVLVEDTYYSENPRFDPKVLGDRALHYAAHRLGISGPFKVVHQESGILPIPLGSFKRPTSGTLASGMRAGLFHPTTSYSLGAAVSFAEFFASHWRSDQRSAFIHEATRYQEVHWQRGSFFRRLNNMLFLAAAPSRRVKIFEQFYKRPQGLIERFYRGQLAPFDKISLLSGIPPIPVGPALRAFINPSTREVYDARP